MNIDDLEKEDLIAYISSLESQIDELEEEKEVLRTALIECEARETKKIGGM